MLRDHRVRSGAHSRDPLAASGLRTGCPTGKSVNPVQPPLQKYFVSRFTQITSISPAVSPHMRGVSRSSRTRDGMRWTRQRRARNVIAGRDEPRER
jgi:hypothetical protein